MFTRTDLINLHNLLSRSTFTGLEEAEVGVYLSHKIKQELQVFELPKVISDGSDLQRPNKSSPDRGERTDD